MTDRMDDLLRDAGRRWRTTQPPPPEPGPSSRSGGGLPHRGWSPRPSRWIPAVVTTGAVAAAVGGSVAVRHAWQGGREVGDHVAVTAAGSPDAAGLVVHDGEQVQASGTVVVQPGQPTRFCAPAVSIRVPRPGDPDLPDCRFGVEVSGVDRDRLTGIEVRAGVTVGTALLRGVWRTGVLHVTEQGPPTAAGAPPVRDVPCSPPKGGWKPTGPTDGRQLHEYVEQMHPDRFRRPWVSYPHGLPQGATSPSGSTVEVMIVEVVGGDIDDARRELRRRYTGNLCLVRNPGASSLEDQAAARDAVRMELTRLMSDPADGIYGTGGTDLVTVDLVVLTPRLYERFVAAGLESLELRPWLLPVR